MTAMPILKIRFLVLEKIENWVWMWAHREWEAAADSAYTNSRNCSTPRCCGNSFSQSPFRYQPIRLWSEVQTGSLLSPFSFPLVGGQSSVQGSQPPDSRGAQWLSYCEWSPLNICYPLLQALVDLPFIVQHSGTQQGAWTHNSGIKNPSLYQLS